MVRLAPPNDFGILLPTTMSTQIASRKARVLDPAAYPASSNSLLGGAPIQLGITIGSSHGLIASPGLDELSELSLAADSP